MNKIDVRGDLSWYFEQHPVLKGYNPHDGGIAASMSLLGTAVELSPEEDSDDDKLYSDDNRHSETNRIVHELVKQSKAEDSALENGDDKKNDKKEEVNVPGRKHIQKWTARIFASKEDIDKLEIEKRHKVRE